MSSIHKYNSLLSQAKKYAAALDNNNPVKNIKTTESSSSIPSWVKNNAKWWSEDLISDEDFEKGVEYLIKTGMISVSIP